MFSQSMCICHISLWVRLVRKDESLCTYALSLSHSLSTCASLYPPPHLLLCFHQKILSFFSDLSLSQYQNSIHLRCLSLYQCLSILKKKLYFFLSIPTVNALPKCHTVQSVCISSSTKPFNLTLYHQMYSCVICTLITHNFINVVENSYIWLTFGSVVVIHIVNCINWQMCFLWHQKG